MAQPYAPLTPSLRLDIDPALPISSHREEILEALASHPVIIVCGATGSGKSTQLPKLCLAAGRGVEGQIGHTQPRRIAARALASRLASELGVRLGGVVGFKVRFDDRTGRDCRVKLMTDGILLRELAADRDLGRYDTLILDEVHERSLNIDLLLGVVKRLAARRPQLKVVITSATLESERLARFFGGAPVIDVSGRSYPVEVRYRPLAGEDEDAAELSLPEGIAAAVRELAAERAPHGDVLVFLPGEKHIREAAEELEAAHIGDMEIVPLYARLSAEEQERIFAAHPRRRVVLATNVAETSLTVPGIRYVVDSGLARLSRYSVNAKVQRLPVERISRASAEQRAGRCGREAPGICIRLYSREDFDAREAFTPPEILRTNLASVILQLADCELGAIEGFPFLDPPDIRFVKDGGRLLKELEAMDEEGRVTRVGRDLASLPCDPRLGRMLIAAARERCLAEVLVIAAFLAVQDPRMRTPDAAATGPLARRDAFGDARSDFLTALNLWRAFGVQAAALSRGELTKWCRGAALSFVRMREWQEVHGQLARAVSELGLTQNVTQASYARIHRAILKGILGGIGSLAEKREYRGARGTRFVIAPGSPLARRPPKWVAAASLTETTRLYARMVAGIDPAWIEAAGAHLAKLSCGEPHWDRARGEVVAFESVSVYGLVLTARRRVSYARIAPAAAHEIFIREALVAGEASSGGDFLAANRRLRGEIEYLEAKSRRRDILVDEDGEVKFYRARIPERVSSTAAFERWRIGAERCDPQLLRMSAADLVREGAPPVEPRLFPDELEVAGNRLPLHYVFAPGAAGDGVTLRVPAPLVDELDEGELAWLVPGLLREKIEAILRALPKSVRKLLVPVPQHARAALAELGAPCGRGFFAALSHWITRAGGVRVSAAQLAALPLPDHLRINVQVLAEIGAEPPAARSWTVVAEGRDLAAIRERLREIRKSEPRREPRGPLHRGWDFGELPEVSEVSLDGITYRSHPAIEDRGGAVARIEARNRGEAELISRSGVRRLVELQLPQAARDLRRRAAEDRELVLLSQGLKLEPALPEALAGRAFAECFVPLGTALPRTRTEFEALIAARRSGLYGAAERITERVRAILKAWRPVRARLGELASFPAAAADIGEQLAALLPPDFIARTPESWLEQVPRYLRAIERRLERLRGNERRDAELARRVAPFVLRYRELARERVYGPPAEDLERFRWMIEEFRVSLYAQELKTRLPVSETRLAAALAALTRAAGAEAGGPLAAAPLS